MKLLKYNNPSLIQDYSVSVDLSYKNTYTLLNTTKNIDNNYSIKKYNLKIIKQTPNNSDNNVVKKSNNKTWYKKLEKL